ncbi:MAG: metal ABC transporter permease [Spirochaetes bacterium]|nr:metal ABC transporter permease [Spirochaetota bacterium]
MNYIIELIVKSFQYTFIQKAVLAGCFIALSSSVLGVFLILKRFALIGDGLAHVSFASISIALMLSLSPLFFSIPFVIIISLFMIYLVEKGNIYQDTVIGLLSSTGIACGVIIASISKGFNVDIFSYLFGSILSIENYEVIISVILSSLVIMIIVILYNPLVSLTFDQDFAKVSKIKVSLINHILIILTSVTIVIGIKVVGTMLISSLIIFPAITSLQISKSFRMTILFAAFLSVLSVLIGIVVSIILDLPTGAAIVIVNAILFITIFIVNKVLKIK